MDVTCPRCGTEYEFEEARVPADGVTVKCTSCSHVFRVKKVINAPEVEPPLPPAPLPREWKVRKPDGNLFEFKELTTLQKWIVERKVGRDDEISLLGDSSELASFFQVVDDARRGEALAAQQPSAPVPALLSPPRPKPQAFELPKPIFEAPKTFDPLKETLRQPTFTNGPPTGPVPPIEKVTLQDKDFADLGPPPAPSDVAGFGSLPKAVMAKVTPKSMRAAERMPPVDDWEPPKQGGAGRWLGVLLVLAGLGGGGAYYVSLYAPEQERLRAASEAEAQQAKDAAAAQGRTQEQLAAQTEARRAAAEEAATQAKAQADAEAAAAKAKAEEEAAAAAKRVDGGAPKAAARTPRDFDGLLLQADRLRERDRPEAAMDLYGAAADLQPQRVEPLAGRGLALLDMGSTLQAEASFEQALKLNPRYAPALMGMAEALKAQGKKAKAVGFYEKYLEVLPTGTEAEVARKNVQLLKGEAP
jgi:predicted Zn finger-like uncharacterized protein